MIMQNLGGGGGEGGGGLGWGTNKVHCGRCASGV